MAEYKFAFQHLIEQHYSCTNLGELNSRLNMNGQEAEVARQNSMKLKRMISDRSGRDNLEAFPSVSCTLPLHSLSENVCAILFSVIHSISASFRPLAQ